MTRIVLAPGWPRLLLLAVPPLAALSLVVAAFVANSSPPPSDPTVAAVQAVAMPPPAGLLVYVSGAVAQPGLYRLRRGERLYAAIQVAGGLLAAADPTRLPDMAQRLRDGQQVKVPYRKGSGPAGSAGAGRVSLNQATLDELLTVPGFTPDIAAAAIQYRDFYGGFANVKELVTVIGMDMAAFTAAKPYIKV